MDDVEIGVLCTIGLTSCSMLTCLVVRMLCKKKNVTIASTKSQHRQIQNAILINSDDENVDADVIVVVCDSDHDEEEVIVAEIV